MIIGNTEKVAALVREGSAHLGFVEGTVEDPALSSEPVGIDELVLVVPPDHPWASRPPDPAKEFRTALWVMREPGSGTRSIFETALASYGLGPRDLDITMELPSNEAVRASVEAGAGVAVISKLVAASSLKAGTLAAVEVGLPKRHFFMLRHKERYVTQAERELLRLVM